MGKVLGFKPKTLDDTPVESFFGPEENCDGCDIVFLLEDLYLDNKGELLCSKCVGNKKGSGHVEDKTS